jgi:hypothetical protein
VDGQVVPGSTPLVVEDVRLSGSHRVSAEAPGRRGAAMEIRGEPGRLVRTVHLVLPSALGSLTVESDPPGAEVRIDGRLVGRTPITQGDLRIDQRHRIDLTLPGHDPDQFVVLPEKDGNRVSRKLTARPKGRG